MRPDPADFRFRLTDAATSPRISCLVSPAMWSALAALPESVLFHPRLLPALEDLVGGVVESEITDAMIDLVLNGAEA